MFSVITVCRNAANLIRATLDSLLAQTCSDWEWIVIDGASNDGTIDVIRFVEGLAVNSTIISEPDSGIYNAMNKGIGIAKGRFVYFLNAGDSFCNPSVLAKVDDFLNHNPATNFVYGDIWLTREGREPQLHQTPSIEDACKSMVCGCLPHQGSFFDRDLFASDSVGMFDERWRVSGDYDWMIRALCCPELKLGRIDQAIANYSVEGVSSELDISLPESFAVLNSSHRFLELLGEEQVRTLYQRQIFECRKELLHLQEAYEAGVVKLANSQARAGKWKDKFAEQKVLNKIWRHRYEELRRKAQWIPLVLRSRSTDKQ